MIRDRKVWEEFEARWQRSTPVNFEESMLILTTLVEHARALGAWPPADPLEGIEIDIKVAKAVNTYVQKPSN